MCGIAGFISKDLSVNERLKIINNMTDAIKHRGPDDAGLWMDKDSNLTMGHRRLSILDLSKAGHQPMTSKNERYTIIYNGEIYNHHKIRNKIDSVSIDGHSWRGTSDTETLLKSIDIYGLDETLDLCSGMFAFVLWDSKNKTITLARDRLGEKPLYYGFVNKSFVFGSELKIFKKFPNFINDISLEALAEYFKYSYVPSPLSIYKNVYKLEPGTYIQLDQSSSFQKITCKKKYWSFHDILVKNKNNKFSSKDDAISALEKALSESIKSQMISDVPLGVFLSGGIDSSLVASLSQQHSIEPIKTFTIGYHESSFDESSYALGVANALNTNHSKINVTEEDAMQLVSKLPLIYDEPFADSSQIPTYFVCKAAKNKVTVALSGDGADELFGGYNRYISSESIWRRISIAPLFLRQTLGCIMLRIPAKFINIIGNFLSKIFFGEHVPLIANKFYKLAYAIQFSKDLNEFCQSFTYNWHNPADILNKKIYSSKEIEFQSKKNDNAISNIMHHDTITYLPDDILCKVDRASMAVSLETRAPFLDSTVIDVATRIPIDFNINFGTGKQTLRSILEKYISVDLIDRPKAGFAVPIGQWLRGPLKDWAEALIDEELIVKQGLLNYKAIKVIWKKHLSGHYDFTEKLWSILVLQLWLEENKD